MLFEREVTQTALKYKGLAFGMGKDPDKDRAADNSHLFYSILKNSAVKAGLKYTGKYMPVKELLKHTHEVHLSDLRNGDLIVLNSGHAALLFGFEKS